MPYSQVQFLWMDSKYKTNGLKGEIIGLTVEKNKIIKYIYKNARLSH